MNEIAEVKIYEATMDRTEGINDSAVKRRIYQYPLLSVIHRKTRQKINKSSLEQHNRRSAPHTHTENSSCSGENKLLSSAQGTFSTINYVTKLYVRPQMS